MVKNYHRSPLLISTMCMEYQMRNKLQRRRKKKKRQKFNLKRINAYNLTAAHTI